MKKSSYEQAIHDLPSKRIVYGGSDMLLVSPRFEFLNPKLKLIMLDMLQEWIDYQRKFTTTCEKP